MSATNRVAYDTLAKNPISDIALPVSKWVINAISFRRRHCRSTPISCAGVADIPPCINTGAMLWRAANLLIKGCIVGLCHGLSVICPSTAASSSGYTLRTRRSLALSVAIVNTLLMHSAKLFISWGYVMG